MLVASLHEAGGRGTYSEPARLEPSPPTSSVWQPTMASDEGAEDVVLEGTVWLLALIGSLTLMLLLIASAMFYYRSDTKGLVIETSCPSFFAVAKGQGPVKQVSFQLPLYCTPVCSKINRYLPSRTHVVFYKYILVGIK